LVLDEPKAKDQTYEFDALKVVIDDSLLDRLGEVTVDYRDSVWRSGFAVTAANDFRGAAGAHSCC